MAALGSFGRWFGVFRVPDRSRSRKPCMFSGVLGKGCHTSDTAGSCWQRPFLPRISRAPARTILIYEPSQGLHLR
jgi:hypothetical protein